MFVNNNPKIAGKSLSTTQSLQKGGLNKQDKPYG
jgi:hypothetical protein